MYKMTYDGKLLLDLRTDKYALRDVKCHIAVNDAGTLDFTIDSTHDRYGELQYMSGIVELDLDENVLYRGRITKITPNDTDLSYVVQTEGLLSCLNDWIPAAFKYPDDFLSNPDYITAKNNHEVVKFIINYLLSDYNMRSVHKVKLGNVSVPAPNDYISVSADGKTNTYSIIKSIISNESITCYMLPRYETDGVYLDFYNEFSLFGTNAQQIRYGDNLLSITDERDASNTATHIVPIGKNGLTIQSLPDGALHGSLLDYSLENDCILKDGDTVYCVARRNEFGTIKKIANFDYVTDATWLQNYALNQLLQLYERKITVTAVDKYFTSGGEDSPLLVGKMTDVIHKKIGINTSFPLQSMDIDVINPADSKIVLGGVLKK